MTLENWVKANLVERLDSDAEEIGRLLQSADDYLDDYRRAVGAKMSADAQLDMAYGAIRNYATASLRAAGYRTLKGGGNQHYYTIESLRFSIDPENKLIPALDKFRAKRNIGNYGDRGRVSQKEADSAGKLALQVRELVIEWIRKNHPAKIKSQVPKPEETPTKATKKP